MAAVWPRVIVKVASTTGVGFIFPDLSILSHEVVNVARRLFPRPRRHCRHHRNRRGNFPLILSLFLSHTLGIPLVGRYVSGWISRWLLTGPSAQHWATAPQAAALCFRALRYQYAGYDIGAMRDGIPICVSRIGMLISRRYMAF